MQIDRILYPVTALGPGNRLCLWTIGCHKRCKKCANPELQEFNITKNVPLEQIKQMLVNIDMDEVDGITVSGGEPFAQPEELRRFLEFISPFVEDILVFSGYTYEDLKNMEDSDIQGCFPYIGVLVAGEYIDEKNDNKTALIASSNQQMIFLKKTLQKKYADYMKKGRQIQNVFYGDSLMSLGIHNNRRKCE